MRALLVPALVTALYTAVTWWLWQAALAPFADLAAEGILTSLPKNDDFKSWELVLVNFEYRGPLRVVLHPIPDLTAKLNSGLIPFWGVALQGLLLGYVAWAAMNWRRLWNAPSNRTS